MHYMTEQIIKSQIELKKNKQAIEEVLIPQEVFSLVMNDLNIISKNIKSLIDLPNLTKQYNNKNNYMSKQ